MAGGVERGEKKDPGGQGSSGPLSRPRRNSEGKKMVARKSKNGSG